MKTFSLDLGLVTDDFAIAPQLHPREMETLRSMGYRSIMVLRPDSEEPGQPNHVQVLEAARNVGLEARYQPVRAETMGPGDVTAFRRNIDAMPAPLVAYSGTGRRAMMLWALAQVGRRPAGDIIERALKAGHDLSEIGPVLDP